YRPDLCAPGGEVELSPEEWHHAARVCRVREGDTLEATDGLGRLAVLRVRAVRANVRAELESIRFLPRSARAWVLTGMPEGGRVDWMVEKLAELGVERWLPLDCERSRGRDGAARRGRWERIAVAAMKQ